MFFRTVRARRPYPLAARSCEAKGASMAARLADIAAQAKVSEATVSRVLNGKPGVADSTRQAVLTALDVLGYERPDPAAAQERRAGRADRPRAGQPDLPGVRAGHRDRAGPARLHPGAVHPDPGRRARGRLHADAPRAQRQRHHLRLRPARGLAGGPRALPPAHRPRPADRAGERLRGRRRGAVRVQRRPGVLRARRRAPAGVGAHQDRPRRRAGAVRAGHPQDRRLPAGDGVGGRARPTSRT